MGDIEGTPSLPHVMPMRTPIVNTLQESVNTSSDDDPSPSPPDWSILSEIISYSTPPVDDIHVEVTHSLTTNTSPDADSSVDISQTSPTEAHIFQPYKGVQACISMTASHDESTDVSTTFIGLVSEQSSNPSYTPEHFFPFDTHSCVKASLPNGETFNILIDTGASRSYLSYGFYLECEYLKKLPTFKPLGPQVYMGNGEWVQAIHIIPIVFHVGNCAFKVYTWVCKMTSSDFIWGIKNVFKTEGVISTHSMEYKFLNRSPKLITKSPVHHPPNSSRHNVELRLDFPKEVSGQAIVKLLLAPSRVLHTIKAPLVRNVIQLQISNHSNNPITHSCWHSGHLVARLLPDWNGSTEKDGTERISIQIPSKPHLPPESHD